MWPSFPAVVEGNYRRSLGRGEGLSALGAPSRRISTLKVCSEQTPGPSQFVQAIGQKQSNFIIWSKNGKMHFLECKCSNRKALSGVPKATVLPVKVLPLTCTVVLVVAVQQCRTLLSVGAVAVLLTQSPSGHRGVLLRTKLNTSHCSFPLQVATGTAGTSATCGVLQRQCGEVRSSRACSLSWEFSALR